DSDEPLEVDVRTLAGSGLEDVYIGRDVIPIYSNNGKDYYDEGSGKSRVVSKDVPAKKLTIGPKVTSMDFLEVADDFPETEPTSFYHYFNSLTEINFQGEPGAPDLDYTKQNIDSRQTLQSVHIDRNIDFGWTGSRFLFKDYPNLTSMTFGNNVENIHFYTGYCCTGLTSIVIPPNVKFIDAAFQSCTNLKEFIIQDGDDLLEFDETEAGMYEQLSFQGTNLETLYIGRGLIGDRIFKNQKSLTSVTIGDQCTQIPSNSFYSCSKIKTLDIPASVKTIGDGAFRGCSALASVNLSEGLDTIGSYAFYGCSFPEITIPSTVRAITGENAFGGSKGPTSITLADGDLPININRKAFYYTVKDLYIGRTIENDVQIFSSDGSVTGGRNLETVVFGNKVKRIPAYLLRGCEKLSSVTLGDNITEIGEYAFRKDQISSPTYQVNLPDKLKTIGSCAFSHASQDTLTIPGSVTNMGHWAFNYCNFNTVNFEYGNEPLEYETPIFYATPFSDVRVDRNIGTIFKGSDAVESLTIGNNVTELEAYAFSNCKALKSVVIEDGDEPLSFGYNALYGSDIKTLYLGRNVTSQIGTTSLSSVTIGNKVTSIGSKAFYNCDKLTEVILPASLRTIGNEAFAYAYGLSSISIPASVTSIGESAFYACSDLIDVNIEDGEDPLQFGSDVFNGASAIEKIHIGRNLQGNNAPFRNTSSLSELTFGDNVTTIGDNAFYFCSGLASITLPASLHSIGSYAFAYTSGLSEISIPASVNSIGDNAFYASGVNEINFEDSEQALLLSDTSFDGLSIKKLHIGRNLQCNAAPFRCQNQLTDLTFGNYVTTIGNAAFNGCYRIEALSIPRSVNSIGDNAFNGCSIADLTIEDSEDALNADNSAFAGNPVASLYLGRNANLSFADSETLSSVTFGDNVTAIGDNAFSNCKLLPEITLPQNLSSIGNNAFSNCDGLTELALPASLQSIGEFAFDGCTGIEDVKVDAVTPPAVATTSFAPETYSTALLTVPEEAASDYRLHDVWSLFTNGNHLEGNNDDENTSGIGSVTDFDENEIVEVYNLSGTMVARSVKNLSPGFYIVKDGNTTRKLRI
ncbi:MAG: leucine-rich repeat domain-containing protein, partial [Muribaculaceae bacterium]|nr:leucine-rich repeat domain-containing protein [Muribaculaceae bacterium]